MPSVHYQPCVTSSYSNQLHHCAHQRYIYIWIFTSKMKPICPYCHYIACQGGSCSVPPSWGWFYPLKYLELPLSNLIHLVMVIRRKHYFKMNSIKRANTSLVSKCLSVKRLQDFSPSLSALRISQRHIKRTSWKIPGCGIKIIHHWASISSYSGSRFAPGFTNGGHEDMLYLKIDRYLRNLLKRVLSVASWASKQVYCYHGVDPASGKSTAPRQSSNSPKSTFENGHASIFLKGKNVQQSN